ncbi:MAG: PIN domain-containing protein [Candidatus Aenigmarchaeota archaeon]|nr:PIN domain-containing protein [Candidatus Aenigmarchaeota archaeon]
MPYADSDFFLALMKEDDWLQEIAERLLKEYKGKIWTSNWAVVELLLIAKEFGLDPEVIVSSIGKIARIEGDYGELLTAAHLMKDKGMTTFDALHAISCTSKDDKIISSDSVYEKIGLERIRLER